MGNQHSKSLSSNYKKRSKSMTMRSSSKKEQMIDKSNEMNNVKKTVIVENVLLPSSTCGTMVHPKSEYKSTTETYLYHGRKYQNFNTKYILPNDELEQDRLTQLHFIYKYLFSGNFSAPVKDLLSIRQLKRNSGSSFSQWIQDVPPPRVLDLACGNGTWILEMATEFPDSQFYGVDLSATYPTTIKPINTHFSQYDIIQPNGLPYPDNYFDYIHMRQVYICFSTDDWVTIMKEIKRLLKPGGYVEFRDMDPILINPGPITQNFFLDFPKTMQEHHSVNILWARYMHDVLQHAGSMTDIRRQVLPLQFNTKGPIGNMIHTSLRLSLDSYRHFFERHNRIVDTDYNTIIDTILEETVQYNSYFNYYCCWGRKPLCDTEYHLPQRIFNNRRYSAATTTTTTAAAAVTRNNSITIANNSSSNSSVYSNKSDDTAIANNNNINNNSNNASYISNNKIIIEEEDEEDKEEHQWINDTNHTSANNSLSSFIFYPWEQEVISLGIENMSDIHQFVEGYED
ncbi:S-adenosyl-L-methionine-dependent methyltransferase [Cokeromyces recurvatus]|uniref:S-adenosyl-L-methionine-dependent methyltransferase n=1 Tax=Cokeromyces recurvatus TaxID=90255 RepID=UPI002220786C|nr:S-adenosyl-L-methionine-dependent methyltransferase [Cokeromyces recurvatus]KAI7903928.1 S-adenosyl-L-methionine-dependent methyltransferase [Cokeromyces recurvatus]